jgi:hypothetical protein
MHHFGKTAPAPDPDQSEKLGPGPFSRIKVKRRILILIMIRLEVKIQELRRLMWRVEDAHIGGVEAQNGAVEGLYARRRSFASL